MGKNTMFSFFMKCSIVAIGFSLIILENQVRIHGFDTVVDKSLGLVTDAREKLGPVLGISGKGQTDMDAAEQNTAALSNVGSALQTQDHPLPLPVEGSPLPAALSQTTTLVVPPEKSFCDQEGSRAAGVVPGDILQLRYFEKSAVSFDQEKSSSIAEIVFERLDLSGTFTVGVEGSLSLPAVGHIDVLGLSLPCIEALVARTAFDRLRLNSAINANFIARPQISLQGAVRSPGTYAFTPSLTVERLLAQAGSTGHDDPASRMRRIELQARASELQRVAQGLSLVQQRLEASLANERNLDFRIANASGAQLGLAPQRIKTEQMVLEAEHDAIQSLREKEQAELSLLDLRIDSAERKLEVITRQHAYFSERVTFLDGLTEKGITTADTLVTAQIRQMDSEYALLEETQLVNQLKSQRTVLQRSFDVAAADLRKSKIDALRDLNASQDTIEGQIATVVAQLENTIIGTHGTVVTINRNGPDGTVQIEASPATELLPGDFVTVVAVADDSAPLELSRIRKNTARNAQELVSNEY